METVSTAKPAYRQCSAKDEMRVYRDSRTPMLVRFVIPEGNLRFDDAGA
jgi:hypothetical protein